MTKLKFPNPEIDFCFVLYNLLYFQKLFELANHFGAFLLYLLYVINNLIKNLI